MRSPMLFPYRLSQGNTHFVASISDLPSPQAGVITLPDGTSWFICAALDLTGARIVCAGEVALLGASSGTASITSTGLTSQAVITTNSDITIRDLTISVPSGCTGVAVTSTGTPPSLTCEGVNFSGSGRSVILTDANNALFLLVGWVGPNGILVNGNINTLGVTESLWIMSSGQTAVAFDSAARVNRRFRVGNCALIVGSGATGFSVIDANIVNSNGYLLDTVNASGSGTILSGLTYLSSKTFFISCTGIINSARVGSMYWTGQTTATTISAINTPVKATLTTTANGVNQGFSHTNNRLTYTGAQTRTFYLSTNPSVSSGNNHQIRVSIYKNGVLVPGAIGLTVTGNSGKAASVTAQGVTTLTTGDYIELWVSNLTAATNITVTDGTLDARGLL